MNIQTIEDLLPQSLADDMEDELLGIDFPWYMKGEVTNLSTDKPDVLQAGFSHVLVDNSKMRSKWAYKYLNVLYALAHKKDLVVNEIITARTWLHAPSIKPHTQNGKHVDMYREHMVVVYYVTDSDGDTIFFDNDDNIIYRNTPKKNTAVLFDGSIVHCSSTPSQWRCIINFDFN